MPVFVVNVQLNRWLLVATDTKKEAEQIVWERVNSDTIDWYDGRFAVTASRSSATEEDEIKLRRITDSWRKESE
jgi:hypothetical protein